MLGTRVLFIYGASFRSSTNTFFFFFVHLRRCLPRYGADLYQGAHDPNSLLHGGFDYIERSGHDVQGTSIRVRNVTTCWLLFLFPFWKVLSRLFFSCSTHTILFSRMPMDRYTLGDLLDQHRSRGHKRQPFHNVDISSYTTDHLGHIIIIIII